MILSPPVGPRKPKTRPRRWRGNRMGGRRLLMVESFLSGDDHEDPTSKRIQIAASEVSERLWKRSPGSDLPYSTAGRMARRVFRRQVRGLSRSMPPRGATDQGV
ncbi:hypothetical protein DQL45_02795 [Cereibacter sphaeroides 2.4.1]|nr:hypothetical protein DQL45_02795 [Cereibacter sphaeroides 2.4.1]